MTPVARLRLAQSCGGSASAHQAHVLRLLRGDKSMHGCHLLRNEMIHFVYNLQYYLMFEVLECSWQTLLEELDAASDVSIP